MTTPRRSWRNFWAYRLVLIVGSITFAVPLVGYMLNGLYMRYSGDDYCYASALTKLGFWKAQWISYLQPQAYNGNRYSLTFFSGLSGLFGPRMSGVLPILLIVIWLAGMFFLLRQLSRLVGLSLSSWEELFLAGAIIFFTLYMAPSLAQVLYWRSGMLPYLAPLVANIFLLGFIISQALKERLGLPAAGIIVLLSLLAGGFSEAATALQLGYLSILLFGAVSIYRQRWHFTIPMLASLAVAWFSTLVALLLLAFSPANAAYLSKSSRPDILTFIVISAKSALSFIFGSLVGLPLPTLILFFLSAAISCLILFRLRQPVNLTPLHWLRNVALVVVSSFLLIVCSTAPSAYIQSAYPELRALFTARFVMVLAIIAIGALSGALFVNILRENRTIVPLTRYGLIAMLAVICVYPLYASRNIYSTIPEVHRWAQFWDARDSQIRQAKRAGVRDLEVMQIDHIIPNVAELSEYPGYWYNMCAAGYYGVRTISADQPGWDATVP